MPACDPTAVASRSPAMKRIMPALIFAAAAATLAGCVPSTYGYGNYGGYGARSPYGSPSPYGSTYPYGAPSPYGQGGYYGSNSGYGATRPAISKDGTFRCESNEGRTKRWVADTPPGVRLIRRGSDAHRIRGRASGSD